MCGSDSTSAAKSARGTANLGVEPFADPGGKAKRCVPFTRTWTPWRDAQQKQNGTSLASSASPSKLAPVRPRTLSSDPNFCGVRFDDDRPSKSDADFIGTD